MTALQGNRARLFVLALLLALTAAAYWPGLAGGYLYDDGPNIVENVRLHIHSLAPDALFSAAFSSHSGPLMRPVSMLTFALNYYAFGLAPYSFKATNLVIHLLNGVLIFWLTTLILRAYRGIRDPAFPEPTARWLSLAVTGAWLLHPMNLTPVLYVVQRMASLAALFTLLGLGLYVRARMRMLDGKGGLRAALIGPLACGVLAVFSKETGVLLPVYMLVVEAALFRFRTAAGGRDRVLTGFYAGGAAITVLGAGLWWLLDPRAVVGGYAGRGFTLAQRLMTEPRVVLWYLRLIVAPTIHALGLYHDDIRVSHGLLHPLTTLPAILGVLGLVAFGLAALRKAPLVGLGILWFFTGQLLESTVFPLLIAQEQRNYLADYGILLALLFLALGPGARTRLRIVLRVATAGFLALLFVTTLTRATEWSNPVDQAIYGVLHHPRSALSAYMLGRVYANAALSGHLKDAGPALTMLERAARLGPDITPEVALILVSEKLHQALRPAWIDSIVHKLDTTPITPSDISALTQLVLCLQADCRIPQHDVERIFQAGLASPNLVRLVQHHADLLTIYGQYELNVLRDFPSGKVLFMRAVQVAPRIAQYRINLINLLLAMDEPQAAARELSALRKLNRFGELTEAIAPVARDVEQAQHAAAPHPPIAAPARSP
ncbi:MAG: hypothetical protein ACYC18_07690 [Gammaproteobacteria bacterium]